MKGGGWRLEGGLRGKTCDKHLIVRCLRGEKKRSGCPLIETCLNLYEIETRAFHLHLIGILQVIGRYCQSTRVGWISKECVIVWSSPQLAAIIIKQNAKTLLRPNSSFELTKRRTIHVYTSSACKIDDLMIHNTWKVGKRIPM